MDTSILVSDKAKRIAQEIARRTACDHYRLTLDEQRQPSILDSKVGGLPYWPADREFPTDEQGNKMLLVAQINCAQAALASPLPQQGMLQWFISPNPELMYGCRGNAGETGKSHAVIYHPTIDQSVTAAQVEAMQVPTHATVEETVTPVKREVAVDVTVEQTAMGVNDYRYSDLFRAVVKEVTGEDVGDQEWFEYLNNSDALYMERNMGMAAPCHQMLGYPVFTQDDPRKAGSEHDVLLLQLASQFSTADRSELVMWGDMGAGFLFINSAALQGLNFDKVFYTWDCG